VPAGGRDIPPASLSCFAVTAPGLAELAAGELRDIGFADATAEAEGVSFETTPGGVFRANLHSRIASRVLVRFARFRATSFAQLERIAEKLPWGDWLVAERGIQFRVTCRKSRLYHSDAVAERLARAAGRDPSRSVEADDETEEEGPQLIIARFVRDECTISIDSSGALLHRRGYRRAIAKAPLRETIAAAVLRRIAWDGSLPLADPFCGSGTIAIEGAMIARRIPPGFARRFACEEWPRFDRSAAASARAHAAANQLPRCEVRLLASDRDQGAIDATIANAGRAGVLEDLQIELVSVSDARSGDAGARGWVVTNPPYGTRASEGSDLRNLYARFGDVLRLNFPGWSCALLAADRAMVQQTRMRFGEVMHTSNGGIPVGLHVSLGS
jgi:putative N6-adenine-specific DNA methylase